ncbi:MAG: hypothetical protein AVDCRST_MAG32-2717, partial [uncultured Nocardioides sp.]
VQRDPGDVPRLDRHGRDAARRGRRTAGRHVPSGDQVPPHAGRRVDRRPHDVAHREGLEQPGPPRGRVARLGAAGARPRQARRRHVDPRRRHRRDVVRRGGELGGPRPGARHERVPPARVDHGSAHDSCRGGGGGGGGSAVGRGRGAAGSV